MGVPLQVSTFTRERLLHLLHTRIVACRLHAWHRPVQQPYCPGLGGKAPALGVSPSQAPASLVLHRAAGSPMGPPLPDASHVQATALVPQMSATVMGHQALPLTLEEWIDATATAVAKSKSGKAANRGKITHEIMKWAGPPFIAAMARCLQRLRYTGPPLEWRGGKVWPDSREQHLPLDPTNAKGLLCASKMCQLYSKTLRAAADSYLIPLLGPDQQGARLKKGGAKLPVLIRRIFFQWAKTAGHFGNWPVL